ncbi:General odorant-binding protein 1 [Operophtera brumata]|uniref:General odorant-binding protein 1 n=1 Tax=Operophtera brumata TaxID=104452 RepID=A0A0L7L5W4_OPEBR|nr:General odorant-binding protein 1 [Operophtera brumata]
MDEKVALVVLFLIQGIWADVAVMKDVTLGFGQALAKCREESQLNEEKMEEFFHFWRDDFKFEHRELGCAIQCMSRHFNLLTDSSRMHHENTEKVAECFKKTCQEKGIAPSMEIMVEAIHGCEQMHDVEEDHCWRILRVAECFKKTCQEKGIAPSMEIVMAEFIMESEE